MKPKHVLMEGCKYFRPKIRRTFDKRFNISVLNYLLTLFLESLSSKYAE